jgi:hypothetical protein
VLEEITLPDGSTFRLGNNPAPIKLAWTRFGETPNVKVIPRSEWKGLVDAIGGPGLDAPYLPPVYDQGQIGMCNASATASAMEAQRLKQGLPEVYLSAGDLYHRICGGSDRGSTLEDGIDKATSEGVASVSACPYQQWQREASGAAADRNRFRVLEAYLCPTFDHCFSAVLQGFDLISGIWWFDSFMQVDADGWLPAPRGDKGGHAVHGYRPTYRGNSFGIAHKNSWTERFGVKGRCVFPESCYQAHDIGGWWAVRSIVDEGGIVPPEGK